jgi:uncharacterized protein (TIGR03790 family)
MHQRSWSRDGGQGRRVAVIINTQSPASREIGDYYITKRGIPSSNVLRLPLPDSEEMAFDDFQRRLQAPIRSLLETRKEIDFVVMTKGVPMRVDDFNGKSTDSIIAAMYLPVNEDVRTGPHIRNPFAGSQTRFSRVKFNMVLVTRLDAYSVEQAKRLVDNSLAARPKIGWFLMDEAANRRGPGYVELQKTFRVAEKALKGKNMVPKVEDTPGFWAPDEPLMGYVSWGSNDDGFDLAAYRKLNFHPGAIAETFVSTSGRTFNRTSGGQSLIADLIERGVTGVKGYVSEPYVFALAQPQVLFDRYTGGFTLAETFYAASGVLRWKDIVIGDPLCAPYQAGA